MLSPYFLTSLAAHVGLLHSVLATWCFSGAFFHERISFLSPQDPWLVLNLHEKLWASQFPALPLLWEHPAPVLPMAHRWLPPVSTGRRSRPRCARHGAKVLTYFGPIIKLLLGIRNSCISLLVGKWPPGDYITSPVSFICSLSNYLWSFYYAPNT